MKKLILGFLDVVSFVSLAAADRRRRRCRWPSQGPKGAKGRGGDFVAMKWMTDPLQMEMDGGKQLTEDCRRRSSAMFIDRCALPPNRPPPPPESTY